MSVRFSWTVQEADGDAVVGANVDLYYNGGAKFADMTDNGDGSYYCSVVASGKYDVYIGGVLQDEGTGIWITADDMPTAAGLALKATKVTGATNGNLAGLNASGELTDSTYAPSSFLGAAHVNANGAGGTASPAANKVHNAAAIGLIDAGGLVAAADLEAAIAEIMGKIGTMGITTGSFISGLTNITDCLLALNNQLYDLYLRGGDSNAELTSKAYFIITHSGNTGAATYGTIGNIIGSASGYGLTFPRVGSITGIYATYENYSNIAVVPVNLYLTNYSSDTLLFAFDTDAVGNFAQNASFAAGTVPVIGGVGMSYNLVFKSAGGASYLTNPIVILEVTFSAS